MEYFSYFKSPVVNKIFVSGEANGFQLNGMWPAAVRQGRGAGIVLAAGIMAWPFFFGHIEMTKEENKNGGQSRWLEMKLDTGQKFAVQVLYTGMKTHRIYTNDNLLVCFILQVGGKVSGRCMCVCVFCCCILFLQSLTHTPPLCLSCS